MAAFSYRLSNRIAPVSVAEWRDAARRALPEMIWAYVDDGADSRRTRDDNVAAFSRHRLVQRCLTGHSTPRLATTFAGTALDLPLALAPTGLAGLSHWRGDIACARAAEEEGTRYVLSTGSSYTIEEVADATNENHWFQLYPLGDHAKVGGLLDRAARAGYTALFVTVDVPVRGNRESERTTGMTVPPTLTPRRLAELARHPRWSWNTLRHKRTVAVHYLDQGARRGGGGAVAAVREQARIMQGDLHWNDLRWMRDRWRGRLYVKGVLHPDDAEKAIDEIGAEGVVVSNHGGRQLDGTPATLDALPAIVARVAGRGEVLFDGGIRRGGDVIIALCLGADGVFIGRPYVYGLAAAGERGVRDVIRLLREDIVRDMVLMGCADVAKLDRSWLFTDRA